MIGVGWSVVYEGMAEIPADPMPLLTGNYRAGASPVRMVVRGIAAGDLVWLHDRGGFYLCRILEGNPLVGAEVGEGFLEYDVGHARKAEWVRVPEDLVPGRIQRAVISRRMVCRIPGSARLSAYCLRIHKNLIADSHWKPKVEMNAVRAALSTFAISEIEECVSPDDWEDIITAYLQGLRWVLVKSSCFPTKPQFECRLIREVAGETETAYLQVKSGRIQLRPQDFAEVAESAVVYLFSTHPTDPYPGPGVPGVVTLSFELILAWMVERVLLLPLPLCTQLTYSPESV